MKDTNLFLNDSIMSLNHNKIEAINQKLDSIMTVNKEMMIHKNYFSEIIDTQMDWFALIFLITFGILGLAYWLGIFRYFKKKFSELEQNNRDTRNSLVSRIAQKDKNSKNKIESNYTILDKKIDSVEELITKVFQEKIESLNKDVERLDEINSNAITNTKREIGEIIKEQKDDFEKDKNELMQEIWQTNFNTRRSMFFSCYNEKSYSSALTWIIPMLKMISEKKVDEELDAFATLAKRCAEQTDVDATLKERFDDFIKKLEIAEEEIEGDENKEKLKNVRIQLNKTYYTKIDLDNEKK